MSYNVRDTDNTANFLAIIGKLRTHKIKVGYIDDEQDSLMTIKMTINEYGARISITDKMRAWLHYQGIHLKKSTTEIKVPERSFIRKSFDENIDKIHDFIDVEIQKVLALTITPEIFFKRIGIYARDITRKFITDLSTPPKSSATLFLEGTNKTNPLIDTGGMRKAIKYKII